MVWLRRIAGAAVALLLLPGISPRVALAAPPPIVVSFDSTSPGQVFDGVGVESAAAVTRLFYDYTTRYQGTRNVRGEVLDGMFCNPNSPPQDPVHYCLPQADGYAAYGGSYQVLKVEVGGDTNSSVGSEPSFLRTPAEYSAITAPGGLTAANCHLNRGYEWWLMREAKARNPAIRLGALAIGAPGYLTSPAGDFFSVPGDPTPGNSVTYYTLFAECASLQGTPLDFVGVLNESRRWGYEYTKVWIDDLRAALDSAEGGQLLQHHVQVLCCDNGWEPVSNTGVTLEQDFASDPALSLIGAHYPDERCPPCTGAAPTSALNSGKTLWASEDAPGLGSAGEGDWPIARDIIKLVNEHHLRSRTTSDIFVTPVDAYDDAIALPNSGLAKAATPWSSHYDIQAATWLLAQITEATKPGWRYVDAASCFIGSPCSDPTGNTGSYVTWRDPVASGSWTTVAETVGATSPVSFTLCPAQGDPNLLEPNVINVAYSNSTTYFDGLPSIPRDGNGCYPTTLQPDTIYTLTTFGPPVGPHHGAGLDSPPPDAPLALPYRESFDGQPTDTVNSSNCSHPTYAVGDTPCWTSDLEGAFEVQSCLGGRTGSCLGQAVTQPTIWWQNTLSYGYTTLVGDRNWTSYDVSARYLLTQPGTARLMARASPVCEGVPSTSCGSVIPRSYVANITTSGACEIDKGVVGPNLTLSYKFAASCGSVSFGTSQWARIGLRVQDVSGNPRVTVYFQGVAIGTYTDTDSATAIHSGAVAFGTAELAGVQLDDLCVSNVGDGTCI